MRKGSRPKKMTGSFVAAFDRVVDKSMGRGSARGTIHLKDVRDLEGVLVSTHQKFPYDDAFRALGELKKGDKLAFDADMQEVHQARNPVPKFGTKQLPEYRLDHPHNVRKEG